MRQLLGIAIAFGLLTGATLLAVESFGDRELFVSPASRGTASGLPAEIVG